MPRPKQPARLWLRKPRKDAKGRVTRAGTWLILDDGEQHSTGCGPEDRSGAERAYADYLAAKGASEVISRSKRRPAHEVSIAEVMARYMTVKGPKVSRPNELGQRVRVLLTWWGERSCDDITSVTCAEYVASRTGQAWKSARPNETGNVARKTTSAGARRELEDLRAALRIAVKDKILSETVDVHLPEENAGREDWLTEGEVETLCRIARATTEVQTRHRGDDVGKPLPTRKRPLAHVERFIRVGVQTGTRSGAICEASFEKEEGRPWVDLDNGVFYRRPPGTREYGQKRYPPAPLAPSVVDEMRAWRDAGARYVVELDGRPVDCRKAFERVVAMAKIDKVIVRHSLRHTAATWMMQEGVDLAEAAGYLGMSLETIQRRYAHHHPAHQRKAADKLAERANRARTPQTPANDMPTKQADSA